MPVCDGGKSGEYAYLRQPKYVGHAKTPIRGMSNPIISSDDSFVMEVAKLVEEKLRGCQQITVPLHISPG